MKRSTCLLQVSSKSVEQLQRVGNFLVNQTPWSSLLTGRCRIEFWPVGSLFNVLCSGFNGFFMLNCDTPPPPETGVIVLRFLRRIKFGPLVELWPGSRFHVELWPNVLISRWILTPSLDSTLNCDPGLGSKFNVEFWPGVIILRGIWPGVIIPRWIVTSGHNSTSKCDPGSKFHVELWSGSRFHVEIWPRVMVPRWLMTPGRDSTLNYNPRSEFHVELWPRVMI